MPRWMPRLGLATPEDYVDTSADEAVVESDTRAGRRTLLSPDQPAGMFRHYSHNTLPFSGLCRDQRLRCDPSRVIFSSGIAAYSRINIGMCLLDLPSFLSLV